MKILARFEFILFRFISYVFQLFAKIPLFNYPLRI